jgi:hypothetical protein
MAVRRVLIAAIIRVAGTTADGAALTADLLDSLVVTTVLPLVALVFGHLLVFLGGANKAVDTLPPEIRWYFETNRAFLAQHVTDPLDAMTKLPATRFSGVAAIIAGVSKLLQMAVSLLAIAGICAVVHAIPERT